MEVYARHGRGLKKGSNAFSKLASDFIAPVGGLFLRSTWSDRQTVVPADTDASTISSAAAKDRAQDISISQEAAQALAQAVIDVDTY